MPSRRKINKKARQIVLRATQKGFSYEDIAEKCGVSIGTVKRWISTGRADDEKISALAKEIGHINLSPEAIADILVEVYRNRNRRYRINKNDLKRVAGRAILKAAFLETLSEYLMERGFYFLEHDDFFVVISSKQLLKHVSSTLGNEELEEYFIDLADEIEAIEEDEI